MKAFLIMAVLCIALSAPSAPRSASHFSSSQMMTVARRDRLHYAAPDLAVSARVSALAVVPFYFRVGEFITTEPVNVLGVEETIDLVNWHVVYIEDPKLWIGSGFKRCPFQTSNWNACYRAFVRNENAPR